MPTPAEIAMPSFKALESGPATVSEWKLIEQAQVDAFADATLDHQFIHIDPERAKATPWGTTIAHGFLTLSLLPYFEATTPRPKPEAYQGLAMGINYGLDRVRFPAPVKVGSRVRAHRKLLSAELKDPNTIQLKHEVTVEIEGHDKPACVAETLSRLVYARS
jgi:acyl dehydratase